MGLNHPPLVGRIVSPQVTWLTRLVRVDWMDWPSWMWVIFLRMFTDFYRSSFHCESTSLFIWVCWRIALFRWESSQWVGWIWYWDIWFRNGWAWINCIIRITLVWVYWIYPILHILHIVFYWQWSWLFICIDHLLLFSRFIISMFYLTRSKCIRNIYLWWIEH